MLRARHLRLGLLACLSLGGCTGRIGDLSASGGASAPAGAAGAGAFGGPGGVGAVEGTAATGGIAGAGGAGAIGGAAGAGGPVASACTSTLSLGSTPLRRLSRSEYTNTVRDLFGPTTAAPDLIADPRALGFENNAAVLVVTPAAAERYLTVAEGLAAAATAPDKLGALASCLPTVAAANEAACVRTFIHDFGARAFRRPLGDAEIAALAKLFSDARGDGDTLAQAVAVTLTGMLQSPHFLYRPEVLAPAAGQTVATLSPFELASRLSYLLLGSMPDDSLMAAAAAGGLAGKSAIAAEARRLLDDPRARRQVAVFDEQWLDTGKIGGLQKDAATFPDFSPAIATAMKTETDMLVDDVVWASGGDLMALFTASHTFQNQALSAFYGITGAAGSSFVRVALPPTRAAGLLTQGGVMAAIAHAADTDPTRRGKFVRTQLLCETIPPPPPDVMAVATSPEAGQTTRQHAEAQRGSGSCGGCHQLMDRIGFAFESFDPVGRWRDTDHGRPVDDSGEIVGTDIPGKFDGAVELGRKLASSAQVRRCVVTQWWRFASGRVEEPADACALEQIERAFGASGNRVRDLLLATTQSDGLAYRSVMP